MGPWDHGHAASFTTGETRCTARGSGEGELPDLERKAGSKTSRASTADTTQDTS